MTKGNCRNKVWQKKIQAVMSFYGCDVVSIFYFSFSNVCREIGLLPSFAHFFGQVASLPPDDVIFA
jgi:hypothetical protein